MFRRFLCAAAATLAVVVSVFAARAEPLAIRVGWVVYTSSSVPISLEKKELLTHYGKSYTIEPQNLRSTAATITALASGELDISTLSYSTIAFAIQNAQLEDLRIITDVLQDGTGNHATGQFMVRNDSGIQKVEDLKGRILASLTKGSAVDIGLRAVLRKHGLDGNTDATIIEAQFPNMKALLLDKRVDLIAVALPFSADKELREKAHALFTQKDATGVTQTLVWVARDGWLKKNRAAVIDFLEDSLRVTRYVTDPANHEEVINIVARAMKQPPELYRGWLFSERDMYRDRNGIPNLEALQANIETQRELGFLEKPLDVRKYTDLGYVEAAGARLGKAN
jgi:NitT/TauT family transport system substrate-binding protein